MTSVRRRLLVVLALAAVLSAAATGALAREPVVVDNAPSSGWTPLKGGGPAEFSGEPDTPHGAPQGNAGNSAALHERQDGETAIHPSAIERWRWAMRIWLSRFHGLGG